MPTPDKKSTDKKVMITLSERLILPSVFRKEGNFKSIIIQEDLIEKVKVTQAELKKFDVIVTGQSVTWNESGVKHILPVMLTDLEFNEIKLGLEALDKESKLTPQHSSLYKKFVL